jgi:hypothetical protein
VFRTQEEKPMKKAIQTNWNHTFHTHHKEKEESFNEKGRG